MKETILNFLDDINTSYIDLGPNVKKGNINIQCPLCSDDPSFHMGVDLKTGVFGCWRDSSHSGNFTYLVKILTNCSWEEAKKISGSRKSRLSMESTLDRVKNILADDKTEEEKPKLKELKLPSEIRQIREGGITRYFWKYLNSQRGFNDKKKLEELIKTKKIYCCLTREWAYRLIFPIYYEGRLVTWTSRSILERGHTISYLDLSIEKSIRHIKKCLYDFDDLYIHGGETLFVTEGIFDCLKLQFFLPKKYSATCLFTKTIRDEQLYLLLKLTKRFKNIKILLDTDAQIESLRITNSFHSWQNVTVKKLPRGVNDPGEMNKKQVLELID
jgi:hypothetical protein